MARGEVRLRRYVIYFTQKWDGRWEIEKERRIYDNTERWRGGICKKKEKEKNGEGKKRRNKKGTERCHICDSKGENIERNDRKMADSMLEDEKKKIGK